MSPERIAASTFSSLLAGLSKFAFALRSGIGLARSQIPHRFPGVLSNELDDVVGEDLLEHRLHDALLNHLTAC